MSAPAYRSPLHEMTQTTPTCLWNDSAAFEELTYSMEHGAVGATCNPVIVLDVLKQEFAQWKQRIIEIVRERPSATEREIAWQLVEEISATRAAMLRPIFDAHKGRNGRLSIQTDPIFYRNTPALIEQALRFHALAPNMIVKIPVTRAGVPAIEELTYRGVSINATVSFALPQCIAVAEAVERGLTRREHEGLDISTMGPVCTIMVGRVDDWLRVYMEKENIAIDPGYLEWALKLSRPGSLIVVDNVVRHGAILDFSRDDADVQGIRQFFDLLAGEPRLTATAIQTVGGKGWDGFALAIVKG